ncbi:MAG: DNA translocase FtsK 4TM domain-containing protein [Candidatus Yanofskybacteria bacterium]|nr:DNA translocase FtsK 4TM domain-containing protein [Candidatus Yanofskybacteria bacterium]
MSKKKEWKKRESATAESKPLFDLSQETKNGIWGVLSFGLAILATLAFFDKAGRAGDIFNNLANSLFGWGMFLVPLAFLILGASFVKSVSRKIYTSAIFGTLLFVLTFLALFFIIGQGDFQARVAQGGYLGVLIGFPVLKALSFTSSLIVLVLLLLVSLLIALNISVANLLFKKKEEDAPLQDNVVVKRGTEVVDMKEESRKHEPAPKVVPVKKSIVDEEKEFVLKMSKSGNWTLPPLELLHTDTDQPRSGDINAHVNIIKRTLSNFNIEVEMGEVSIGPTVTQYTLRPAVGVKLSKITTLQPDLSLALAAHPIRVEAPIPGKSLVGIEVPNKKFALVGLRNLIDTDEFKKGNSVLPIGLGRDVAGFPVFASMEKMPHLLVAGATGTGKSVCINAVILSLLYKHSPNILKFIFIDPKRVELTAYNGIPHLVTPTIVDPKKAVNALKWAVREMEKRYELLSAAGARDVFSYNSKMSGKKDIEVMPFVVIVIDELADLMASHGRDIEGAIIRLAQMARAVGIHLIVSTQRPSVEVITGLIKANITSRIAFQVASGIDSRTILDSSGAEKLLGRGDMLFQAGDTAKPRRIQGAFVSEKEVKDVVKFIKMQAEQAAEEGVEENGNLVIEPDAVVADTRGGSGEDMGDDMYFDAKDVVVQAGKASASLLQRRLRVGYARAARLLDLLEEKGVIGPGEGAKPREVFIARSNMDAGIGRNIEPDDGSMAEEAPTEET